jgi:hypothetical protein
MITMRKTAKGSWVGRHEGLKLILFMTPNENNHTIGEVRLPDGTSYKHAFFAGTGAIRMLEQTVQGFTHLFEEYPAFKEIYDAVFKSESVDWEEA